MLARPHPVFGDWCFAAPGDSQRLLDKQLSFRDKALAEDPNFSGMPPEIEQWCRTSWLPANLGRDYYRKQADLIINHLRWEVLVDRQRDAFDVDYVAEFYFYFLEP